MKFFKNKFLLMSMILLSGCSSFGENPDEKKMEDFKKSSHFDKENNVFVNRDKDALRLMRKRSMSFSSLKEFFFGGSDLRVPKEKLPEVKPDFKKFLEPSEDVKVIWFGHSSILLNIKGTITLIDPVLSNSTGPFGFMMKRFQKTIIELTELPPIDLVLISHDHYDHLDMDTIKFFQNKNTSFITPLGVGSHLKKWGIKSELIKELDWWEEVEFKNLKLVATPAQHFSGRSLINSEKTLWASWVIKSNESSLYFSGDSGYDTHFKEIGNKYGPFDLAFIEDGQYNEKWKEVHMLPHESIQAFKDLKGKLYFPIHWGMFNLSLHSWMEPIEKISKMAKEEQIELVTPTIGEMILVPSKVTKNNEWWRK